MTLSDFISASPPFPYEYIKSSDPLAAVKTAERVLKSGYRLAAYPAVLLDAEIPWAFKDQATRSWNFHIHEFEMVDFVLKAHAITQEPRFLQPALRIALDWARRHPDTATGPDVSPMAWYDMAVAMRAYRFAYIYDAAMRAGLLSNDEQALLFASLQHHCAFLAQDSNIAFHTNHGFYQAAGQLALGRRLGHLSADFARMTDQGNTRLMRMIDQQFSAEGVHKEHSPGYHFLVFTTLAALIRDGLIRDDAIIARAAVLEEALAWFVMPDGRLANFGDTDYRDMRQPAKTAERTWMTPHMRALASEGQIGALPSQQLQAYPDSGYAIIRALAPQAGDTAERLSKASYIAQTASFHSRAHKHADDLSLVWQDKGHAILTDAGRYGYVGKTAVDSDLWRDGHWYADPMRVHMECTRAHNALEFDGRNYQRHNATPYGSGLAAARHKDGVFVLETRVKQFRTIWHDRVVLFRPQEWLVVFDSFNDTSKAPHDVKQWFHIAAEQTVLRQKDGYGIALGGGADHVQVQPLLGNPELSELSCGAKEPLYQGWWSKGDLEATPAPAFCFSVAGKYSGKLATLFSFGKTLVVDRQWSAANVAATRFRAAWQDDRGSHRLVLARDGDWTLGYKQR